MKYEILDENGNTINVILADEEFVRSNYQRYRLAVEEEHQNSIVAPQTITPRQIRQQLTAIGLRQQVEDLISSSADYDLKDWWNYSQDFQRSHPILKEMGDKLGMSEEDMDSFFIEASKL